jgi:hypothetical protein
MEGLGGFAVLGGTHVTNIGPSVLNGDLGLSDDNVVRRFLHTHHRSLQGTSVTGFGPGIYTGILYDEDQTADDAQGNLYNAMDEVLFSRDRGDYTEVPYDVSANGLTVLYKNPEGDQHPGDVHYYATSFGITGTLTLDANNDIDATFIFLTGSTFIMEVRHPIRFSAFFYFLTSYQPSNWRLGWILQ